MDEAVHTFEVSITGRFTFTQSQMEQYYGVTDPQEAAQIDLVVVSDDVGAALEAMVDSKVTCKVVTE